jgi:hypothetical protein
MPGLQVRTIHGTLNEKAVGILNELSDRKENKGEAEMIWASFVEDEKEKRELHNRFCELFDSDEIREEELFPAAVPFAWIALQETGADTSFSVVSVSEDERNDHLYIQLKRKKGEGKEPVIKILCLPLHGVWSQTVTADIISG